jgi:parallel beta-helix repeat protein
MLVFLLVPVSGATNIFYIDVNGPNDPGSGTFEDPFLRIQDAINTAQDGDVVEIRPGIYTGEGNYNLDPNGKPITIQSTKPNNPDIIECTIIDPNWAGRGFYFHSGEDSNCIIEGLTIKKAYTVELGAGIYCEQSNPTIISCAIIDNYTEGYGGGLYIKNSSLVLKNCIVSNNTAYDGGGLECWSGSPYLINCIISNNHANRYGGGIDCYSQGNPKLTNCTLANNIVEPDGAGGALCLWGSNVNVKNSIIWANKAEFGRQLYLHFASNASVSYCDVEGGISGIFAVDSNVNWGSGNIDIDPCFAVFDPNGDPNLWDLHLQSEYGRWDSNSQSWVTDLNTSLCIDAGDPNSEWSDEPWPNGKRINLGAYGGTDEASKNGNPADFDINGEVNFKDFALLADKWMAEGNYIEDLSNNGTVDSADLRIFTDNWLWQQE